MNSAAKRVLIVCVSTNDWLYPDLMRVLRERHEMCFDLEAAADRVQYFQALVGPDDRVSAAGSLALSYDTVSVEDAQQIYATARAYEARYDCAYMRDIVQPDHRLAARFLNYAPNSSYADMPLPDPLRLVAFINRCFEYFEGLFDSERYAFIINRPGGVPDTVMAMVAERAGIPMTFFHGSYYGSGAQWANGPLMGDAFIREVFERTADQPLVALEDLTPSATWTRPAPPSVREFLVTFVKTLVIYLEFAVSDLKARRRARRVSLVSNLVSQARQFRLKRFLEAATEARLETLATLPFVYVPMPHEPEFTVQSLCKEFADPTAMFRQLALALPAGYRVVLKEHQRAGNRARAYYQAFMDFPNVIVAHPGLRGVDLISRCVATASMGGSTPAEAAMFGKPSVVFGERNPYTFLPNVTVVTNPRSLVQVLRGVLKPYDEDETRAFRAAGARFRAALASVSFDVAGTVLFRSGTGRSIPAEEVEKAADALLAVTAHQRARLDASAQPLRAAGSPAAG